MVCLWKLFLLLSFVTAMTSISNAITEQTTASTISPVSLETSDNSTTNWTNEATTPGMPSVYCTRPQLIAEFPNTLKWIVFFQRHKIVFILPIAFVGNVLAFIGNYEKARKSSPHFYMTTLSVADMCSYIIREASYFINIAQLPFYSSAECMLLNFSMFFFTSFSVWILVVMTVERVIVVWIPLKASQFLSSRTAAFTVTGVAVALVLLGIPKFLSALYYFDPYRGAYLCVDDRRKPIGKTAEWIASIMTGYLPAAILGVSNLIIIVGIQQARKRKEAMTSGQKSSGQDIQVTIMMIVISITFVILVTPEMLINTGNVLAGTTCEDYINWAKFALTSFYMYDLNNSINGYLYCLSSAGFRKELRRKLCCGRGSGSGSSMASSTRMTGVSVSAVSSTNFAEKTV